MKRRLNLERKIKLDHLPSSIDALDERVTADLLICSDLQIYRSTDSTDLQIYQLISMPKPADVSLGWMKLKVYGVKISGFILYVYRNIG